MAERGEPLLIANIEENEVYSAPNNPQYDTVSLVSVPLRVNDVVVGVINVNNKTNGSPFDHDDLNLLISFSERISRALERVRVVEDSHTFLQDTIEAFKRMLDNAEQDQGDRAGDGPRGEDRAQAGTCPRRTSASSSTWRACTTSA